MKNKLIWRWSHSSLLTGVMLLGWSGISWGELQRDQGLEGAWRDAPQQAHPQQLLPKQGERSAAQAVPFAPLPYGTQGLSGLEQENLWSKGHCDIERVRFDWEEAGLFDDK